MLRENDLLDVLSDWNYWGTFDAKPLERPIYLARLEQLSSPKTATVLLGVRRAGKSSLTQLFIRNETGAGRRNPEDTLVINFEDPRFHGLSTGQDLLVVFETYLKQLQPARPLVVLDEVQDIEGWEKFVRYLLETRKASVVVTGSSSKLLAREISTVLTGRHVDMEVFPLSFAEFLSFKGLQVRSQADTARHRIEIQRWFDQYLQWGGFPEVALTDALPRRQELLSRYFDDIVMKDIVRRFSIMQVEKLERLTSLLLANIATLQSFNKIKDRIGASLDTVERFCRFLELARMFFFLKKFDYSKGRQLRSISKTYVIDPGFYTVKGFKFTDNLGRVAENVVAVELLRRAALSPPLEIYYWKDYQQREVDFVLKKGKTITELLQVCWDVGDDKTRRRELNSLVRAASELRCEALRVITHNYEGVEKVSKNGREHTVHFIPLWRWLLQPSG